MIDLDAIQARADAATRPIPSLLSYEASADGHIWSIASNWRGYGRRPLIASIGPDGYLRVRPLRDGCRVTLAVHRLVAEAFHGQKPPGAQIRHLDGNQINNAAGNLAYGTAVENAADREAHGRTARGDRNGARLYPERLARGAQNGTHRHPERLARGERQGSSKTMAAEVRQMRELAAAGWSSAVLGKRFGLHPGQVRKIVSRRAWAHVA